MDYPRIVGPIRLQYFATVCAQCHIAMTEDDVAFLLVFPDSDETDVYVHDVCMSRYLRAYTEVT